MPKAVIFDLDGTLADACEVHRFALNQALLEVTGYEIPKDDLQRYEGLPTKNKLLILSNEGLVSHDQHGEVNKRKQELTLQMIEKHICYSIPITHMMRRLEQEGVKVAVVTNCTEVSARLMLDRLGISQFIRTLVTAERVQHPKPDPEGLQLAMLALGVTPDQVIYVGDQPVDAKAAYEAGVVQYIHVNSVNDVSWELLRCRGLRS